MNRFLVFLSILCAGSFGIAATTYDSLKADFYVASNGSDSWSGSLSDPNSQGSDGPFASLDRARDAVRELKKHKSTDIVVLIRGGNYQLDKTVVFGVEDSGVHESTITYAAYPGEKPVFSSGLQIKGWKRAPDDLPGLPKIASGKVWVAELSGRFKTLYNEEGMLPRARSRGFTPVSPSSKTEIDEIKLSRKILYCPPGTLKNWPNLEDVEIVIRPQHAWILNILPLERVDEETQVASTTIPGSYPLRKQIIQLNVSETCWVENVLEALDEPGEWVLNSHEGKLYIWPKDERPPQGILAPQLLELIRVEGDVDKEGPVDIPVKNLCFKGLTFMHGKRYSLTLDDAGLQHDWEMYDKASALVRLRGTENCIIEECHFSHSGSGAIRVDLHGINNIITGNYIEHIGGTGILLCGYGPGTKDVNRHNLVYNNHIHHTGEIYWHSPGVFLWQSGENRVANNLIHHTPYSGIIISGCMTQFFGFADNRELVRTIRWHEVGGGPSDKTLEKVLPFLHTHDNKIEYNEIHHVMEIMGDGNGIYIRGAGADNLIRRNYIHHLLGPTVMQAAIRTDGGQKDTLIAENLVYKCVSNGITLKLNNSAENNILIDILQAQHKGQAVPASYFKLREGPMTGATLKRNILYHSSDNPVLYNEVKERRFPVMAKAKDSETDYNIYFCAGNPELSQTVLEKNQSEGIDAHSLATDPLFVDLANGDFRLQPDSPALKLGIVPVNLSKIGLEDAVSPQNKPESDWKGEFFLNVPYKQVDGRKLLMDIYLPAGMISNKAPVIYYVHGGGWAAGNKEKFSNPLMLPVFQKLSEKGFVAVSVNYRLWKKGRDVLMRDCVTDAMDGLRFLKKNAEKYGIDPERIVVFGDSAGGQIAQMLNYASPDGFPGDATLTAYGVQPLAGISWYGPSDFTDINLFKTDLSDKNPNRFGERITGAETSYADNPKAFKEMSSYYWIRQDSPTLLLLQGDTDATIPMTQAIHLKDKADRIGADVEMVIVKNAGHNWRKAGGDPEPGLKELQRITVEFAVRLVESRSKQR